MAVKGLDHINFVSSKIPETINFYNKIIGLQLKEKENSHSKYFHTKDSDQLILHIQDANYEPSSSGFKRLGTPTANPNKIATGNIDHFCIALDLDDYQEMLNRLTVNNIDFDINDKPSQKQIWFLDPNGIRVELSFF